MAVLASVPAAAGGDIGGGGVGVESGELSAEPSSMYCRSMPARRAAWDGPAIKEARGQHQRYDSCGWDEGEQRGGGQHVRDVTTELKELRLPHGQCLDGFGDPGYTSRIVEMVDRALLQPKPRRAMHREYQ